MISGKNKFLGLYDTEQEAHQAYLEAKKIYHVIEIRSNECIDSQ